MKKIITSILIFAAVNFYGQNYVSDFETFTLSPNTFYHDTNSTPFQTPNGNFSYKWTKGSFPYWSGGFSYTNKYDSSTAGFTNIYGVKAYKGYNNSAIYTVAKDESVLKLQITNTRVMGFYYTNTTFAYKAMKNGDSFSRKFGDTTGTGSGTTIAQGAYPDYFKVVIKGYKNGVFKNDSVEFYLADFRSATSSQDYIVSDWRFVNTEVLGIIDSLKFFMRSSDAGQFGINTPAFFAMDNFTTEFSYPSGVEENILTNLDVFPNPFSYQVQINLKNNDEKSSVRIISLSGSQMFSQDLKNENNILDLQNLCAGIYILEVRTGDKVQRNKIIKE